MGSNDRTSPSAIQGEMSAAARTQPVTPTATPTASATSVQVILDCSWSETETSSELVGFIADEADEVDEAWG